MVTGDEYIGVTADKMGLKQRCTHHKSRAKKGRHNHLKLYANINEYGWDNFTARVLCGGDDEEYLVWLMKPTLNDCWNGRKTPEHVKRAAAESHHKPVRCVETGEVYESITAAGKAAGVSAHAISNHLRGKTETSAGHHWKYA